MVAHRDLIKQMEYCGSGLRWTGFYVHHKFADQPNPQNLVPYIRLDPVPLPNARPNPQIAGVPTFELDISMDGLSTLLLTANQTIASPLVFYGTPSSDPFYIQFPVTPGSWTVRNATNNNMLVSLILPINPNNPAYSVPAGTSSVFYGNGITLSNTQPTP